MDLGTTTLRRLRAVFGSSKLHPLCSSQGPLNPDPVLIPIQVAPLEPERLSRPESRDQQKAPQCRDDLLRSVSLPSHPDLLAEKLQTRSILTLHLVSFQGVRSIDDTRIELAWNAPDLSGLVWPEHRPGAGIYGYQIEASTDGGTTWTTLVSTDNRATS